MTDLSTDRSADLHKVIDPKNKENVKWIAYKDAPNENLITSCCPSGYFRIRWLITKICHFRLLINYTIGEVFFFILSLIIFTLGSIFSEATAVGGLASLSLAMCFTLSTRNSIWLFLFGIPFERALFWHKFYALISIIVGAYHGLIFFFEDEKIGAF
jgi:hypothetical protein